MLWSVAIARMRNGRKESYFDFCKIGIRSSRRKEKREFDLQICTRLSIYAINWFYDEYLANLLVLCLHLLSKFNAEISTEVSLE